MGKRSNARHPFPHLEVGLGELVAPAVVVVAVPLLVHDLRDADDFAVVVAHGHAHQRAAEGEEEVRDVEGCQIRFYDS